MAIPSGAAATALMTLVMSDARVHSTMNVSAVGTAAAAISDHARVRTSPARRLIAHHAPTGAAK